MDFGAFHLEFDGIKDQGLMLVKRLSCWNLIAKNDDALVHSCRLGGQMFPMKHDELRSYPKAKMEK